MSESLDSDPNMVNSSKGTRLTDQTPAPNAGACQCWTPLILLIPTVLWLKKYWKNKIRNKRRPIDQLVVFENKNKENNSNFFPFSVFSVWHSTNSRSNVSIPHTKVVKEPLSPKCFHSSASESTCGGLRQCCWLFRFPTHTDTQVRTESIYPEKKKPKKKKRKKPQLVDINIVRNY